ncbi:MAG: acetylglutamate kinase [Spirochaetales bacterium]|nr:acetylglutamate kinase [Spirochaetales bacterium]
MADKAMEAREPAKPLITVKIGGKTAEDPGQLIPFAADLKDLLAERFLLIVHGGGAEVSRISRQLGFEPRFHEGIRITLNEEMDAVEMILSGGVNKRLVRLFQSCGLPAVGLCGADGATFTGRTLGKVEGRETRTGNVARVDGRLLSTLFEAGFLPVLSSTCMDERGVGVNINADSVAFEVACSLRSESLVFISDIPGVMKGERVLKSLNRDEVRREIAAGTISGGMIPKATSAVQALEHGVGQVIIGRYCGRGCLRALLQGEMGTCFHQ